jgi:hypothetical protein
MVASRYVASRENAGLADYTLSFYSIGTIGNAACLKKQVVNTYVIVERLNEFENIYKTYRNQQCLSKVA